VGSIPITRFGIGGPGAGRPGGEHSFESDAAVAQSVERVLGKDEVLGSNPSGSFGSVAQRRAVYESSDPGVGPRPPGGPLGAGQVDAWGGLGGFSPLDHRDAVKALSSNG
jgi:hypothetical protein